MPKLHPIVLTPLEKKIFDTLLYANQKFNLGTIFRICGGWVRDRLLGTPSDDLDITLNNRTGKSLESYLLQLGPKYGIGKSYTVDANIEKSKHLETVAIEIWGEKIDFVNLRSETYGDSRVPTMEFGSPEVDAQRRDLTIGALFLNINTGQIEDYVNGLQDLENMILRTPMNPKKTLMDDPLRATRTIRLFSKYPDAKIAPELIQAMSDPEVHEAYKNKVSPTRAAPELLKLLAGAKPAEALRVMFQTGIGQIVFSAPETQNYKPWEMDQKNVHHEESVLDHTLSTVDNLDKLLKQEKTPANIRVLMLMSSLLHDISKRAPNIAQPKKSDPNQMSYIGHELESVKAAEAIMKNIGIPDHDRKFVEKIIELHMRPHTNQWSSKALGKFMRDSQIPGVDSKDIWRYVMLHSIADGMSKGATPEKQIESQKEEETKRQHMKQMEEFLQKSGPSLFKPVIDGKRIIELFSPPFIPTALSPSTGFIKEVNEKLLNAQAQGIVTDPISAEKFVNGLKKYIIEKYTPKKTIAWINKNCKFASESGQNDSFDDVVFIAY